MTLFAIGKVFNYYYAATTVDEESCSYAVGEVGEGGRENNSDIPNILFLKLISTIFTSAR